MIIKTSKMLLEKRIKAKSFNDAIKKIIQEKSKEDVFKKFIKLLEKDWQYFY